MTESFSHAQNNNYTQNNSLSDSANSTSNDAYMNLNARLAQLEYVFLIMSSSGPGDAYISTGKTCVQPSKNQPIGGMLLCPWASTILNLFTGNRILH